MARLSGYNFYCNDVNGDFGTNQTASGVPISETHYTAAIPMNKDRTPYRLGDVVLIKNTQNNTSALYHITDVGGLPHADIDVVSGVGLKAIGVDATIGKGGGVVAVSQKDGFETQKVGKLPLRYGDKQSALDLQLVLADINQGKSDISALQNVKGFESGVGESEMKQKLVSFAPNVKPDSLNAGKSYSYDNYNPSQTRRPKDEYMAYIQDTMEEDPLLGFLMLIIAVLSDYFDKDDVLESNFTSPEFKSVARSIPDAEIQSGKARIERGEIPANVAEDITARLQKTLSDGTLKQNSGIDLAGLKPEAQAALAEIAERYKDETGDSLRVTSGYRDPYRQAAAVKQNMDGKGEGWINIYRNKELARDVRSAYPDVQAMGDVIKSYADRGVNMSPHMSGDKFDIATSDLRHPSTFKEIARDMKFKVLDEGNHLDLDARNTNAASPYLMANANQPNPDAPPVPSKG